VPLTRETPVMFGGRAVHIFRREKRGRARIRALLQLGLVPASGFIAVGNLELGTRVFSGPSQFWRTKVVQLNDRFQIVNTCDKALCIRQVTTDQEVFIAPSEDVWYHWESLSAPRLIIVRIAEPGWLWSGMFKIRDVSLFEVYLAKVSGVRARLTVQSRSDALVTGMVIRPSAPDFALYRVVNNTHMPLLMRQVGIEMDPGEWVNPKENAPFAYHEPAKKRAMVLLSFSSATIKCRDGKALGQNELPYFSLEHVERHRNLCVQIDGAHGTMPIDVHIYFKGATKVFEVKEAAAEGPEQEEEGRGNRTRMQLSLQLRGVGISLVDARPREVMHMQVTGIRASYEDRARDTLYQLDVQRLQVDNMLYNPMFPIVLWPKQPSHLPLFHIAANVAKGVDGVVFVNGLELVVQETEIRVDEAFLAHTVGAVSKAWSVFETTDVDWDALVVPIADFRKTIFFSTEGVMYAREIYIGPLAVSFSYSASPWGRVLLEDDYGAQIESFFNYLNATFLYDVNAAAFNIGMIRLVNVFHPRDAVSVMMVAHYKWQLAYNFFRIMGPVPVLGAPTSVFYGIASGVQKAFFAPSKGPIRSAAEFGDGMRRRSSALFNGTIGAVMKEVAKATAMTSAMAAKLTLDDDYKRRRLLISQFKAKTLGQALLFAARDIGTGFLKAVTGIVVNPIQGSRKRGLIGFGTGLGVGILGLATKPLVGILDAVGHISQGVQTVGLQLKPRFRRTRAFDQTRAVLTYDQETAEAQEALQRLQHGKAVAAFLYPGVHEQRRVHALVSNKSVFCVSGATLGNMQVVWRLSLSELQRVLVKDHIVVLISKPRQEVHELEMVSMEEAVLVFRKLHRALNAETERSLEHVRASAIGASTAQLVRNLEHREVEAARAPESAAESATKRGSENAPNKAPERSLLPDDKGKEEAVW
jgi:vacuolar protein sorting-associated protein 13A/C